MIASSPLRPRSDASWIGSSVSYPPCAYTMRSAPYRFVNRFRYAASSVATTTRPSAWAASQPSMNGKYASAAPSSTPPCRCRARARQGCAPTARATAQTRRARSKSVGRTRLPLAKTACAARRRASIRRRAAPPRTSARTCPPRRAAQGSPPAPSARGGRRRAARRPPRRWLLENSPTRWRRAARQNTAARRRRSRRAAERPRAQPDTRSSPGGAPAESGSRRARQRKTRGRRCRTSRGAHRPRAGRRGPTAAPVAPAPAAESGASRLDERWCACADGNSPRRQDNRDAGALATARSTRARASRAAGQCRRAGDAVLRANHSPVRPPGRDVRLARTTQREGQHEMLRSLRACRQPRGVRAACARGAASACAAAPATEQRADETGRRRPHAYYCSACSAHLGRRPAAIYKSLARSTPTATRARRRPRRNSRRSRGVPGISDPVRRKIYDDEIDAAKDAACAQRRKNASGRPRGTPRCQTCRNGCAREEGGADDEPRRDGLCCW